MAKKTLSDKAITKITEGLAHYLSDTFILYVKTLNFHWNMVGNQFYMFHKLLEEQYRELAEAIDDLAERIRHLGHIAPGSMAEFLELGCLKETKSQRNLAWEMMIGDLVALHFELVEQGHHLIKVCDAANDQGTSDLLIERIRFHAKQAWLLRSHLE